jgi:quaternary ammonium compound-resistance protein SugE
MTTPALRWGALLLAGIFEAAWPIGFKIAQTRTHWEVVIPSVLSMILSVVMFGYAVKNLPIGTAYGVWTALSITFTVIAGVYIFKKSLSVMDLFFILCLVVGTVGLYYTSSNPVHT